MRADPTHGAPWEAVSRVRDTLYVQARSLLSSNPRKAVELLAGSDLNDDPEAQFLSGVAQFSAPGLPIR